MTQKIIYTLTDEAPAIATYSFLPIVQAFSKVANIEIETKDISLSARILANLTNYLTTEQQVADDLTQLGKLAKLADTNIIKLPNISASVPQLIKAITELQQQGYKLPNYPSNPKNNEEIKIKNLYAKVLGSAVNPVLREGNSDRRAPAAVKNYAKQNPHAMGAWSKDSKTIVKSMSEGDFYASENSITLDKDTDYKIILVKDDGKEIELKGYASLLNGEIIDTATIKKTALTAFLKAAIKQAKQDNILFSLHLKATMMKVSDPIIFGQAVNVFFKDLFSKHQTTFNKLNINVNNGFGDIINKIQDLTADKKAIIEADIANILNQQPDLAMVDSDKGISNLHVPSDVIIDASMPAMIRTSGKMWDKNGNLQDTMAVIPDRCYAGVYAETINFCKINGAFDPTTMGTVPNIGLMAQKAEEYGSHDKTFQAPASGIIKVITAQGETLLSQEVATGDIFRMCQTKDVPIQNWVQLAVTRAKATGYPIVFWLDNQRAHDQQIINKVNEYLLNHDTTNIEVHIKEPAEATRFTLRHVADGQNIIAVTGNVLRDYLTDLFPIIELGTSAKMLSIVPLMNGGGLFETGAGGSAPKHVQQFIAKNHLRWDSLGEFLALGVSYEHLANKYNNKQAKILALTLDIATQKLLDNNKSPAKNIGQIDNKTSHFYLTLYWAEAIANQQDDLNLQEQFTPFYKKLLNNSANIIKELNKDSGNNVDIQGYFKPSSKILTSLMRPSPILNAIIVDIFFEQWEN